MNVRFVAGILAVAAGLGAVRPGVPASASMLSPIPQWMAYTRVPQGTYPGSSIAVDSNDVVHWVQAWFDQDLWQWEIRYRDTRYTGRGINGFSAKPEILYSSPQGAPSSSPDVAVGPDGSVHVVWIQGAEGGNRSSIYYRRKTSTGWDLPMELVPTPERRHYGKPQIHVDDSGQIHVVATLSYEDANQNLMQGVAYIGPGGSRRELTGFRVATTLRMAVRNGRIVAAWDELVAVPQPFPNPPLYRYECFYVDFGGAFSLKEPFVPVDIWRPDVAIDSSGAIHLVWATALQPYRVYYQPPGGGPQQVSQDPVPGQPQSPDNLDFSAGGRIAIDSAGTVHILYDGLSHYRVPREGSPERFQVVPAPLAERIRMPAPNEVAIGPGGDLHVISEGFYTRTLTYSSGGTFDDASLVEVFPGGSVNALHGNLLYRLKLFEARGVGPTVSLSLTYNSAEYWPGLLAPGWSIDHVTFLIDHGDVDGDPNTFDPHLTLVLPGGRFIHFNPEPALGYLMDDAGFGYSGRFFKFFDQWVLQREGGTQWYFNTRGQIDSVVEPDGNSLSVLYDGEGRPVYIVDMGGRYTGFDYEIQTDQLRDRRIQTVTDPSGNRYEFGYSGRRLTSVTFAGAPERDTVGFDYHPLGETNPAFKSTLLGKVLPPRGMISSPPYGTTIAYSQGRVVRVEDPAEKFLLDGEAGSGEPPERVAQVGVFYDDSSEVVGIGRFHTRFVDRRGASTIFVFDPERKRVVEVWDPAAVAGAPGILPVRRVFDALGNLVRHQDRWGHETTYTYVTKNAFSPAPWLKNQVETVSKTRPDGQGMELEESFTYTRDDFGLVETHTTYATPTGGTSPEARTVSYRYNAYGQREEIVYPDGSTRRFVYAGPRRAMSEEVNEEGYRTRYLAFDSRHALPTAWVKDGGSQPEEAAYDDMGNLVGRRRPQGRAENDPSGWTLYGLDGLYRVRTITDPAGWVTRKDYDLAAGTETVRPPAGGPTVTHYDRRGFVSAVETPDGTTRQWVDAAGNVRRKRSLRGHDTHLFYDALGRVIEERRPGGSTLGAGLGGGGPAMVTRYEYDLPQGAREYAVRETRVGASGPSRVTTKIFDLRGRPTAVLFADGRTREERVYDEQGQEVARQLFYDGILQTATLYFRDRRDRIVETRVQDAPYGQAPARRRSSWTLYRRTGAVVQQVNPLGDPGRPGYAHKVTYVLDERDRVVREIDGLGQVVRENVWGDDDLLVEVRVPDPERETGELVTSERLTYTARKEVKSRVNRNGFGVSYTYGELEGRVRTATDALGRVTETTYYADTQRVDEVIRARGTADEQRTKSVWAAGLLAETRVWNPEEGAYTASYRIFYDQADRPERREAPRVGAERQFYNEFGEESRFVAEGQPAAKVVDHEYNALGLRVRSVWSGAYSQVETRTYNGSGLLESVSNGVRERIRYYDVWRGTLREERLFVGGVLFRTQFHDYDLAGRYTHFQDSEGGLHEWRYDEAGRLREVRFDGRAVAGLSYAPGGRLRETAVMDAAGTAVVARTLHRYDGLGRRVRQVTVREGTGEVVCELGWGYDEADRVRRIAWGHLGAEAGIEYDGRDQVVRESLSGNGAGTSPPAYENQLGGPGTGLESVPSGSAVGSPAAVLAVPTREGEYRWDRAGNRTWQRVGLEEREWRYNSASQLVSEVRGGVVEATRRYDDWGNLIERQVGGVAVERYGYTYQNRLGTYQNVQTGALWQYEYGPEGERVGRVDLVGGREEHYTLRGEDVAVEYERVGGGELGMRNRYVQGAGVDQKYVRLGAGGERRVWVGDQVGTLTVVLGGSGEALERQVRDVWGNRIAGSGSERYGLAQREEDGESGLVFMRARMYDPRTGRFTQTDPLHGSRAAEHYVYGFNNPVSMTDPTGLIGGPILPPQYWNDPEFRRGFHSSMAPIAKPIIKAVVEVPAIVHDVALSAYVGVHNAVSPDPIMSEDVTLYSGLGNRLKSNVEAGKSRWQNARAGAVTALAGPTGGASVLLDNIWTVFEEGMTPEEASAFLWEGATNQVVLTGVAAYASAAGSRPSLPRVRASRVSESAPAGETAPLTRTSAELVQEIAQRAEAWGGAHGLSKGLEAGRLKHSARAGTTGRVGRRASEFAGGRISESGFLNAVERYLGSGYREVSPGRYVSADGLRQVRFGAHEVRGPTLHGHFEAFDQPGGRIIENTRVNIFRD